MYDFVICGAQKSGTTSLHHYLSQVAGVCLPRVKEIPFYSDDALYSDINNLHGYFDKKYLDAQGVRGMSYVNICYFAEKSIPRLLEHAPSAKFVMLVREPVARAVSAYSYALARGWETEPDILSAFHPDRKGRFDQYFEFANLTYVDHSLYGWQVEQIVTRVGESRLLLLKFEDLVSDPGALLAKVGEFIGVEIDPSTVDFTPRNKARTPRSRALQRTLLLDSPLKRAYHRLVPKRGRRVLNRLVTRPLEEWNLVQKVAPDDGTNTNLIRKEYGELFSRDAHRWQKFLAQIK